MKYYIIAGEPSGDLHGSNLMKAILERDPDAEFRYWGGDHMAAVSDGLVTHIRETSIMGFVEVIKNISKIKAFFKKAKASITEFEPDKIIYIDYPGFNLRMAEWSKKNGYYNAFYISPQLWAWKKGRVKKVKKYIDDMICILPFEKDFYAEHDVNVHYVGHPLLPVIGKFRNDPSFLSKYKIKKPILAILPGSRQQEISKLLPSYLEAAKHFSKNYQVVIAAAPNVDLEVYEKEISKLEIECNVIQNETYNILDKAEAAIVTSGTATLETSLFEVPQVVCYKTSSVNYQIGKRLVDLKYICLVNLILDTSLVPELIQDDVNPDTIITTLEYVLANKNKIKTGYDKLKSILEQDDSASDLAADIIVSKNIHHN